MKNHKENCKRYERTEKGKLMRVYRNMQSRVTGVQKKKHHLYEGKSLLPREAFYEWALASDKYKALHRDWRDSGFERKLAPSVDRIDPSKGYEIGNIEWVTHSENSRRGGYCTKGNFIKTRGEVSRRTTVPNGR